MTDKAKAAIATLENLGYTHEGGILWKPPLGKAPDFNLLDTLHARIASLEAQLSARQAAPDGQWKCGNEYLPYHPDASHVDPAYRDGWNDCYRAAPPPPEREPLTDELIWAMEQLMNWQVKNVKKWHNHAYDNAQHVLVKFKAAHGIGATNDNP